jgi:predicted DNA-binding ribbon-helix-helix protein
LETPFFDELHRIAGEREIALASLIATVDETRPRETNLSSALRVFVLNELRAAPANPPRTKL